MKKGIILLSLLGLLLVYMGIVIAADLPKEIVIENKGYSLDTKGPVTFQHAKHTVDLKIACTDCHHVYKDGKNTLQKGQPIQKCSACHDVKESKGNTKKLQLAYHTNCKDCHKTLKKGPVDKCTDCHAKK
jgi:hypothetical protein